MSVLLRDPGGFEGFRAVHVARYMNGPPVPERPHVSDIPLQCDAGPGPQPMVREHYDPVTNRDELSWLDTEVVIDLIEAPPPAGEAFVALIGGAVGERCVFLDDEFRVPQLPDSVTDRWINPFTAAEPLLVSQPEMRWTISTFSCDIAYSDSPTASRASAGSK